MCRGQKTIGNQRSPRGCWSDPSFSSTRFCNPLHEKGPSPTSDHPSHLHFNPPLPPSLGTSTLVYVWESDPGDRGTPSLRPESRISVPWTPGKIRERIHVSTSGVPETLFTLPPFRDHLLPRYKLDPEFPTYTQTVYCSLTITFSKTVSLLQRPRCLRTGRQ